MKTVELCKNDGRKITVLTEHWSETSRDKQKIRL